MPKKDSSWIEESGLFGTWTFTTQTMTDVGYYKGLAYVVMHIMPDPMQVKSCLIPEDPEKHHKACIEMDNHACSHGGAKDNDHEECVNIETSTLEWSDVSVFFQFGFRLRTGIVKKTYHQVHTSDWLGPYNMILAPIEKQHHNHNEEAAETIDKAHDHHEVFVSRYVNTPWTKAELQRPFASSGIFNFDADILEDVVGLKAINKTIYAQKAWRGTTNTTSSTHAMAMSMATSRKTEALRGQNAARIAAPSDDPYAKYSRTCSHGDLQPILPRLEVVKTTHPSKSKDKPPQITYSMRLDYSMLSLPKKGIDSLYKLWPTMKSHLGGHFPLRGPYCYGKDPNRAYAIHLSYDSAASPESSIWKGVKACVPPWPCWQGDAKPPSLPPSSFIPKDNNSQGSYVLDPKGLEMMIVYAIGLLLVVSLVFNCQLANKLKALQQSRRNRNNSNLFGQEEPQTAGTRTPPRDNRTPSRQGASYRQYLQEAVEGSRSNSSRNENNRSQLEEPLLTASSSETETGGSTEPAQQGVEESKQEAE